MFHSNKRQQSWMYNSHTFLRFFILFSEILRTENLQKSYRNPLSLGFVYLYA